MWFGFPTPRSNPQAGDILVTTSPMRKGLHSIQVFIYTDASNVLVSIQKMSGDNRVIIDQIMPVQLYLFVSIDSLDVETTDYLRIVNKNTVTGSVSTSISVTE